MKDWNLQANEEDGQQKAILPSFYVCGAGGNFNCPYWDDINGCWQNQTDPLTCPFFEDDMDGEE